MKQMGVVYLVPEFSEMERLAQEYGIKIGAGQTEKDRRLITILADAGVMGAVFRTAYIAVCQEARSTNEEAADIIQEKDLLIADLRALCEEKNTTIYQREEEIVRLGKLIDELREQAKEPVEDGHP